MMEARIWGVYTQNGEAIGLVEAESEALALEQAAREAGYKNVDEAQASMKYWVEEVDA